MATTTNSCVEVTLYLTPEQGIIKVMDPKKEHWKKLQEH